MRLTFAEPVYFPAGLLRGLLARHLPLLNWTCGEDDDGGAHCRFAMNRSVLVRGSRGGEGLFISLRVGHEPLADAPHNHAFHISVECPEAEPAMLDTAMAAIALAFSEAEPDCRCQPAAGQAWLVPDQTKRLASDMLAHGGRFTAGRADQASVPASPAASGPNARSELARLPFDDKLPAERSALLGFDVIGMARMEESMADVLHNQMGSSALAEISGIAAPPGFARELPSRQRLPTLVILFSAAPLIDWAKLQEGLDVIDPEGRWQARESGSCTGTIHGRGTALTIDFSAAPLPAYVPELALWRSFWVRPGEALRRLRRHSAYVSIDCDLDCEAAEFADIRQSAKAMTLALAVIAKFGPCAGVMNAAQSCIYTEDQLDMLVGPLGNDEVSIKLFIWTAFHSTKDDAISLSTAGMLPFVGREVEAWNAPGSLEFVGNKLNGVLRYLLINGPVIHHGDTIGEEPGDRSVKIYHGESDDRSARPQSVPVLYLEFEGPGGALAAPRPDPAVPAPAPVQRAAPGPVGFGRRAAGGGFGRKGL